MNRSISYILVLALSLFLFLSCSDGQEGTSNTKPEVQGKTIALTFSSQPLWESEVVTRSTGKGMDILMGEESDALTRGTPAEEKIDNVCIFQFEGSKESSNAVLRAKFYLKNLTNNTQFITPVLTSTSCFLYVCANVGDLTSNYTVGSSTFQKLMDASLIVSGQYGSNSPLPMSGCADIGDNDAVSIALFRMLAKVTFTCDLSQLPSGDVFDITSATLRNVSKSVTYYPPVGNVAVPIIDVSSLAGTPLVSGSTTTYTWYMPENLRGAGKNTLSSGEWTKRIEKNAPNYATYIELMGDYTASGSTETFTYVIYLGNGDINNYDVQRNYSYQITARIKGKNITSDLRVSDYTNLSADGLSNCYLASKDNYKYCFNGTVRGNGNTDDYAALQYPNQGISLMPAKVVDAAPDAVTIPADQIRDAVLMWETAAGIINEVKWDAVAGRVKFKTGKVIGNALIAVYNASGRILWSWHIWRTDGVGLKELDESYKVKMQTYNKRTIYVMDRCIGVNFSSIPPSYADCVGVNGLYYQFGRKDPFVKTYAASGIGIYHAFNKADSPGSTSLENSIENPHLFYCNGTFPANWISTAITLNSKDWMVSNCLWGDNSNDNGIIDQNPWDGRKTIYDPSPAGWRVVPADTWTGVLTNTYHPTQLKLDDNYIENINKTSTTYLNGWTVIPNIASKPIYLPASGHYSNTDGTQNDLTLSGYNWTSSSGGPDSLNGVELAYSNGLIYIAFRSRRALGFPVRCAKE